MTILNHPVWPFPPNWTSSLTETLEWLTDVMQSPSGSEQRRTLRYFPRRTLNFTVTAAGDEHSFLDMLLAAHATKEWYLPLWHDTTVLLSASAGDTLACEPGPGIKVGTVIFIAGETPYDYQIAEVLGVSSSAIVLTGALSAPAPAGALIYPMTIGRLVEMPQLVATTDTLVDAETQFRVTEAPADPGATIRTAGPLIVEGLVANAYHSELGRGGYFHPNSGTSEGQFVFIHAAYRAYEELIGGTQGEKAVARWYKALAESMLDAIGKGEDYFGPMLRQPFPANANTLTLMHWLFAAKGDVPGRNIILNYEVVRGSTYITIPASAGGDRVVKIWQIYPASSALLYDSPESPAFDIASPAGETQLLIEDSDWEIVDGACRILFPTEALSHNSWKIVYATATDTVIPRTFAYEAHPTWVPIERGYAACAPDTFRWFEQAMQKAIALDGRSGAAAKWTALRDAMRRSAVKGQAVTDQRLVFEAMPGFPAIPLSGAPEGMYCYSDVIGAEGPPVGGNPAWSGYTYWSRNNNGTIIGRLPAGLSQIGRGFADRWRVAETYQAADQYLYIEATAGRALEAKEHFRVYVSATANYDPAARWYADITYTPSASVQGIFIPRSAFRLSANGARGEDTVWGATLPAGTELVNFGIEAAVESSITVRLKTMRLVSDNTAAAVEGDQTPFFPGAMPFAINADLIRQRLVGWNGSPFHGYQLPDHWWWLGADADAVHPTLTPADLPIPAANGSLTHPISATTAGGGATKPANALLMEQQIRFLDAAQDRYESDGGIAGFFAHTFVLNTDARASISNPIPHTWVYIGDDPNTRWVGYQTRAVESLAELVSLTTGSGAFSDARALALTVAENWLTALDTVWPNLTGTLGTNGATVYGMPTDFPDPAESDPYRAYEEPHAAAQVLRACVTLRAVNAGTATLHNELIERCWDYLEMMWRTSGEMAYTWSPDPANRQWYGFWHGEIIATLAHMLANPSALPPAVNTATVRARLVQTQSWLEQWGVARTLDNPEAGLIEQYRGFHVLTLESDWTDGTERGQQRLTVSFDARVAPEVLIDTALRPFPTQRMNWVLDGQADHARFYTLMQALRGRAVAVWVPTWMTDMRLAATISAAGVNMTVARCGFTLAGGPQPERQDVMIELIDGSRFYRRIVGATISGQTEVLQLDNPLGISVTAREVLRISFMSLMRLDHDSIEIDHLTDMDGMSEVQLTFRAAPDSRVPDAAFYEV